MNPEPSDDLAPALPWLPPALLAALSLVYYAFYLDAGFNIADEGNYLQFAYELSLGANLADLPVSYGFLWFKAGEWLFRLFGPNLFLARLLFFACALATSLLVYLAIVMLTGRRWLAAAFAAVPALAPAFLPTAFYGLCVLINAVPQIRLAQRLAHASVFDAALAAAALALSFQIRPDFGYIFAAPLAILLILSGWSGAATMRARFIRTVRLVAAALAAFIAAHLPAILLALDEGFLAALIDQYLSYPMMLASYGVGGLASLFGGAPEVSTTRVLLQRPRLWGAADLAELQLALLVYLPPLLVAAFAGQTIMAHRHPEDRGVRYAVGLVIFMAGIAALPHYFFYRPDLSHIANYMPGFTVLAAALAATTFKSVRDASLAVVAAATLGLYLWTALTTEGSGSIAGAFGRTERFAGANGVNVRLSPGEKALYEDIKAVIEANSAPGAAIVCVPYCPGIAFMTGRRLLFREQYVDDSLPARDPGWIARASALTAEKRPPVVIVMDWAINGTDISRFSRWASPYMETLESLARQKIDRPGVSIYLL